MNTHLATTQIRMQNWISIINDQKASGLKVDDYCDQHQLSRNAYYYWLRKIKRTALESSDIRFAEVPGRFFCLPDSSDAFVPQLTIRIGRSEIGINELTPKHLLSMACEVISCVQ